MTDVQQDAVQEVESTEVEITGNDSHQVESVEPKMTFDEFKQVNLFVNFDVVCSVKADVEAAAEESGAKNYIELVGSDEEPEIDHQNSVLGLKFGLNPGETADYWERNISLNINGNQEVITKSMSDYGFKASSEGDVDITSQFLNNDGVRELIAKQINTLGERFLKDAYRTIIVEEQPMTDYSLSVIERVLVNQDDLKPNRANGIKSTFKLTFALISPVAMRADSAE